MKGPRELKRYVSKHKDHLRACKWDDLFVMKMYATCKKWYKRDKRVTNKEFEE